jgi:hypothetical protein
LWVAGKLDQVTTFPPGFDPAAMLPACFAGVDLSRFAPERTYAEELRDLAATVRPHALSVLPFPTPQDPPRPRWRERLAQRLPWRQGYDRP